MLIAYLITREMEGVTETLGNLRIDIEYHFVLFQLVSQQSSICIWARKWNFQTIVQKQGIISPYTDKHSLRKYFTLKR